MSLKLEHHSNWKNTEIKMSLKINFTQIKVQFNLECQLNWNLTEIGM